MNAYVMHACAITNRKKAPNMSNALLLNKKKSESINIKIQNGNVKE